MSYQRLIEDHDEIDRLARGLGKVADAACPAPAEAAGLLAELATAVSEHLSYEDRRVYSRLIETKPARPGTPAIDFEGAFDQLRADWTAYLADWNAETLAFDWLSFRDETRAIMARLRARVRDETDLIYPLAMQSGFIRLRSTAA